MSPKQTSTQDDSIENLKSETWTRFFEITHTINKILDSNPITLVNKIEWVETPIELNSPRFGVTERTDSQNRIILQISKELLRTQKDLLNLVLWREAFLMHLPRHIIKIPEAADIGLFCYAKYGINRKKARHRFTQIWETVSPAQEFEYYRYHPSAGFPYFDSVTDGKFLQKVKKWLNIMGDFNIPMTSTTFTAALEQWMINFHRILKPIELKILRIINDNPTLSQNEIGERLGLRQSTISRTLHVLTEKHLLRFRYFLNLPLIGLNLITVKFDIQNLKQLYDFQEKIFRIRYTQLIQEYDAFLLASFAIPTRRLRRFRDWVQQISTINDFPKPIIHTVKERTLSRNFDLYDPKRGGWPTEYESTLDNIFRLIDERWTEHLPKQKSFTFSSSKALRKIKLHPEDFVYIQRATDILMLTSRIKSYEAQEARKAGFQESEHMAYRRRIEFLKRNRVLSPPIGIYLRHIGLDATLNIYIQGAKEENQNIFRAFQLLPYLSTVLYEDGNGAAVILLPKESAVAVKGALEECFMNLNINSEIAIKPTWQADSLRRHLTVVPSNYDFKKHMWIWTKDTLPLKSKAS